MSKDNDFISAMLAAAILSGAQKKEQTQQKENGDTSATTATVAKVLHETYNDLQYVGFTSEQAFQLTLAIAKR